MPKSLVHIDYGALSSKRVCVTGGAGFLGKAVCRRLRKEGVNDIFVPRRRDFDLVRAEDVERLFERARPQVILHLAAEVGGIGANQKNPGRYFYVNMAMGLHLMEASRRHGAEKFVQVGTVCSYPRECEIPFCEDQLWNGFPEETNAPYGVAKRALGVMLEAYRRQYGLRGVYLIPINLYGPEDNFDSESSHVVPAMIRRFCEAVDDGREAVTCWGSGQATREFLYVDDAAEAIVRAAAVHDDPAPINLGTGREISIARLAEMIAELVGFRGRILWDAKRTDGQPRRRLDTSAAERLLGWNASTKLEDGLKRTISWWRTHQPASAGSIA